MSRGKIPEANLGRSGYASVSNKEMRIDSYALHILLKKIRKNDSANNVT